VLGTGFGLGSGVDSCAALHTPRCVCGLVHKPLLLVRVLCFLHALPPRGQSCFNVPSGKPFATVPRPRAGLARFPRANGETARADSFVPCPSSHDRSGQWVDQFSRQGYVASACVPGPLGRTLDVGPRGGCVRSVSCVPCLVQTSFATTCNRRPPAVARFLQNPATQPTGSAALTSPPLEAFSHVSKPDGPRCLLLARWYPEPWMSRLTNLQGCRSKRPVTDLGGRSQMPDCMTCSSGSHD